MTPGIRQWTWAVVWAIFWAPLWATDISQMLDRGKSLFDKGKYAKAMAVFIEVKKLDPANPMAREYIAQCMDVITEKEKAEKFKKTKLTQPTSALTLDPQEKSPGWVRPTPAPSRVRYSGYGRNRSTFKTTTRKSYSNQQETKPSTEWQQQHEKLAGTYQGKILEGPPIQVERHGQRVEVVAFLNRLFLPYSDVLAPDAVEFIEAVSQEVANEDARFLVLRAADALTPAIRHQMLDLPSRRVSILFTHFVRAVVSPPPTLNSVTYTPADLDE